MNFLSEIQKKNVFSECYLQQIVQLFLLLMFENIIEKGLFTFYWEEAEKQNRSTHQQKVQQLISKNKQTGNKKVKVAMEEKQVLSSPIQRHTKTKTMDLRSPQLHLVSPHQKQNRQYLQPNTLDISSKLAQSLKLYQSKSGQLKPRKAKQKEQAICKLPLLKSTFSPQQSQAQLIHSSSSFLEKLTFKEQNASMRKLTIKMQEEHVKSPKQERTLLAKKTKKMNTQQTKRQKADKKMSGNFMIIELGNKSKNLKQLPILTPRNQHKRAQKGPYTLQKLMMQRMQVTNGYSSVINIGITSNDQYKQRWLKRKQQFLNLLAKNMSGQILRE